MLPTKREQNGLLPYMGNEKNHRYKDSTKRTKKRKAFYELYTGTQWGVAENYEVCLDSGKIGINGCIAMISAMYKHKFAVETKNNAVTK